jgi:cellulose synthase operon protein C
MRAKTVKRWLIFIVVLGLIAGTGFFVQRFQIIRLAKSVVERADSAAKEGNFIEAEKLYWEHLVLFPGDMEIKIKYADVLLKAAPLPKRQAEALQIYREVLTRSAGRDDVRRKRVALKIAMGRLHDADTETDLKILLKRDENKKDGDLLFLMGRCCEDSDNDVNAVMWYREAIKNNAPQRIEAYQRLATLLRSQLGQPKDADQAIEEMVKSAPENYLVYLERGRYRRQFGLPGSGVDFRKALELAEGEPDVYLELAKTAEAESGYDSARQIFELGLKKAPVSTEIYEALTSLELRTGHTDRAVETLEIALKSPANKGNLRWILANVLAIRGDTDKLRLQIEELRKIGYPDVLLQILNAYYWINSSEFVKARQILVPLESVAILGADLKARINDMLARCYSQLGEPGMQQEAYLRALAANPRDITARLGLINRMVNDGEIEAAINEYRNLVKTVPQVKLPLAQLLMARNRQRPLSQRDWNEVKSLIDAAEKSSPQSADPPVVRAEFYSSQSKFTEAWDQLAQTKLQFPKSVVVWNAQAELLGLQKRFDEARNLLDRARDLLGDRVELRLERARLSVTKGGPQVVKDLNELAQNLGGFSKEDRRKLLNGLATELRQQQDLQDAIRLWSRLAEGEPNDLELRLTLLDLAFQTANGDEIEKNIKQIGEIEGGVGLLGRYCQVRYLIWQAEQAWRKDPQKARRLRTQARVLLNELASRRPDWSVIPLALAQLEQQELDQGNLKDDEIQEKEESIIYFYRRAIDLGERRSAIVRDTVRLLFKNKRGSEALDLLNGIPLESQLAGDLGRQASRFAVDSRDFQRAEEIARKMVAANSGDFQERIWLVQILLNSGRQDDAETEIRQAVELSKTDPDRWITLVQFMVITKQLAKAEKAIKDAEAVVPPDQVPLALAQCCEMMGRASDQNDDGTTKRWYARATEWFEKAKAANPGDFSIVRRLTGFYVQTKQIAKAEAQLNAILKDDAKSQSAEKVAWARRTLALALSTDRQRVHDALAVLEGSSQSTGGQGATVFEDPEDLRVLARVLEAQKTVEDRKRAIEILESLIGKNLANADDRFLLARLYEISGDWPRARVAYRELNLRTKNTRDMETLNRRPLYLVQFVNSLLRNYKAKNDEDLVEAEDLVNELKQLQPDQLNTLVLEVEVARVRNQVDKAVNLIQSSATRPNLAPLTLKTLAELVEKLGRFDIAEQLYRRYEALPNVADGKIVRAKFLGRRGHIKDALDLCEPLWANPRDAEIAAATCISLIASVDAASNAQHVERVTSWLEQAIKQRSDSTLMRVGLGNCRERQERYDEAKTLYESVIKQSSQNAAASPNTNRLIASSYNNLAWLLALKDNRGKDALADIDNAIKLAGALPDYLDTRGVIYLSLKQTQDAIKDLQLAVEADPSAAKLFHLAQAYLQDNNKEKAKHLLNDAREKKLDGPGALHPLEQSAYQKFVGELESP